MSTRKGETGAPRKLAAVKAGRNPNIRIHRSVRPISELKTIKPFEATVAIGDKVNTPFGKGEVVKIQGKECLVALDSGPAKIWRPIRSVV